MSNVVWYLAEIWIWKFLNSLVSNLMKVFKLPGFKFDENLFGSAGIDPLRLNRYTAKAISGFDIQRSVHCDVHIFIWWKPTRCTISQIYLIKYSACFRQVHCPSSGVSQYCIHTIGICHASSVGCLPADTNRTSMTNTYCVYTVFRYSWWWTVDLSETCRVLYQINLRNSASCWLSLYE